MKENNKLRDKPEKNYCFKIISSYHYEIVAIIAIISLLANIIMMTWSVNVSKSSTDLDTRPYVSVNMEHPIRDIVKNDTFYGNNIVLKNKGKIPASKVNTQYYITTDLDKENRHGLAWFDENLGGFGSVSFIAPDATELEPGFRSLSPSAEYYYFEAIVSYEGLGINKKYWTHIRKVFYVDQERNTLYAINIYGEWDRNKDFRPPTISKEDDVINLLEKIKEKRTTKNLQLKGGNMEHSLLLKDLLVSNFRFNYLLIVILISLSIRLIMSIFKAFAIKQGEADDKKEGKLFSQEWSWREAYKRVFRGFGSDINVDDYWLTVFLGSAELFTYPILLNLDKWQYIGVWIGIKTASTWGPWRKTRTAYSRFLFGNLLVLAWSVFLTNFTVV